MMGDIVAAPTVFISYSQDSEEHKKRVLDLSNRLRGDGVDCSIDQYEESPPEGWTRWVEVAREMVESMGYGRRRKDIEEL